MNVVARRTPRPLGGTIAALLLGAILLPGGPISSPVADAASILDTDIIATLDLPQGDIDFELDVGTLHFFDEERTPFALEIIDGCAVNGHLWVFGAGLSAEPTRLTIIDRKGGADRRLVLPPFVPGEPIGTVLDTEALDICSSTVSGGLPPVSGSVVYSSALARCPTYTEAIELHSEGATDAYRTMIRSGTDVNRVIRDRPITVVDEAADRDELHLLAEGRTPRLIEGVVFSGGQGMLPSRAALDRRLADIRYGRVRRAFEAAKNGLVPDGMIRDLGLRDVDCVHHVSFQLDSFGADAWLAQAGWIRDGGVPLVQPEPVEERFTVELVRADGEVERLPLVGPLAGTEAAGTYWEYQSGDAKVQILDGCGLSGSMWTAAAAETDEPLQLVVTDTLSGATATHLLWTDRSDISRLTDTAALPACA